MKGPSTPGREGSTPAVDVTTPFDQILSCWMATRRLARNGDLGNDALAWANWRQLPIPPAKVDRRGRTPTRPRADDRSRQIACTHTPQRAPAIEPGARPREGNASFQP
jgi:hypothetical protein